MACIYICTQIYILPEALQLVRAAGLYYFSAGGVVDIAFSDALRLHAGSLSVSR